MFKTSFDEKAMRETRLVLCPSCDNEMRVEVEEEESVCGSCGGSFCNSCEGSYPEEFIWHPSNKF